MALNSEKNDALAAKREFDPYHWQTSTLDPEYFAITEEDKKFMREYIGFTDDDELKAHIFEVQKKAYAAGRQNNITT